MSSNVNTRDFVLAQQNCKSIYALSVMTGISESQCKQRIKKLVRDGYSAYLNMSYSWQWNADNRGRKKIADTMRELPKFKEVATVEHSELMQQLEKDEIDRDTKLQNDLLVETSVE